MRAERSLTIACLLMLSGVARGAEEQKIRVTCALPEGTAVLAECPDIPSAQRKLRELRGQGKLGGPVEVVLTKGIYAIAEPLQFTPADSGTERAPVTFRAETPGTVTISGGLRITGWRREAAGVWRADVPAGREGKLDFRQLFVDGRRAVRARSPNDGFFYTAALIKKPEHERRHADGFYYVGSDLTRRMAACPDTLLTVYQSWIAHQYRIKVFDPEAKAVLLDPQMDVVRPRSRYFVENAPECLDSPGEWHLDRAAGVVRYVPLPGEDLAKATVIVPRVPALLQFKGDPERGAYVEHLHFRGITFAHADWQAQGHAVGGPQAQHPVGFATPDVVLASGAVAAIGLRHASIEDCEITRIGAHAVVLLQGCADNVIRKCHMHDLGGGGVYLFWAIPRPGQRDGWQPRGAFDSIVRNTIDNCYIHDMTRVFQGAVGVLTGPCAAHNRITHNEISHGDYTGISVGWGWTANPTAGFQDGNVVEFNHVHHVMNCLLDDGGGIYLLGWQRDGRVCHNWIHDVRHDVLGHGAKGIYPDQGTAGVLFEGNVVHDVVQGFGGNGGHQCVVRNNIFAFCQKSGVMGGGQYYDRNVTYNPHPITFEHNVVYQGDGQGMLVAPRFRVDQQVSRENVYWAGPSRRDAALFRDADAQPMAFGPWQAKGHDAGSVMADPLFVDAAKRDLRLRPESPALRLGFQPTDLVKVGLYGPASWTSLPGKTSHAPIVCRQGPGGFAWTHEDEKAGAAPVHSGELALGPDTAQHKLEVIDTDAASGKHCLMVREGKPEGPSFFPLVSYPIGTDNGPVEASFRLKIPSAAPSALYFAFRDYHNPGDKHFQTGPKVQIDGTGRLTVPETDQVAIALPRDVWVGLQIKFLAGREAPKSFDLFVSIPGQSTQVVRGVSLPDPDFQQVTNMQLISSGPPGGVFLIDDLRVSTSSSAPKAGSCLWKKR